ncbi:hypothetical protein JEQ12_012770 [Ovis aries]|uniref:Uncharacterized protein n=1 Tax=Ovis aries TaxID=9940 RepID=A0A835ZNC8_SHEEP|nr:hypothetical protein JEQ12_012770 [Ovis aries]
MTAAPSSSSVSLSGRIRSATCGQDAVAAAFPGPREELPVLPGHRGPGPAPTPTSASREVAALGTELAVPARWRCSAVRQVVAAAERALVRPLTHWELAFESTSPGSPMKANPSTLAAPQHDRDKYCAGGQEPRAYLGPELHAEDPALPPPHRVGQEMAPQKASPRTPS